MKNIVLSCFDRTGNMVRPWAKAGYRCFCVDIQHPAGKTEQDGITLIGADMLQWMPDFDVSDVLFQAYFPPCTDLAVSGARWFQEKGLDALIGSLKLFNAAIKLAESIPSPYMIENPVSTISSYWRKPDFTFDPCDYAGYAGGARIFTAKKHACGQEKAFACRNRKGLPLHKEVACT